MSLAYKLYKKGNLLNGRYKKVEDISEGAYGIVSLAKDTHNDFSLVAVKYIFKYQDETSPVKDSQFSKSLTSMTDKMDDDICEEALHEIDIHQKLGSHPNIVSLVDCFDSFIILEYCPRGDLYEAIRANMGPSSTRDIINVMMQLIDAVEYAHKKSIYHRDIKPENILIADDFTIRLSDWGLASSSRLCKDFGIGSERYMAPELFDEKNVRVYDASKCDIWSIGICLLNIVFHKSPFKAANQTDKSFTYFASNREALFDIFSTMSDDLFAVLRYSLTLDPENRDLSKMKEELLKVDKLTFDEDLYLSEQEISETDVQPIAIQQSSNNNSNISGNGRPSRGFAPKSFAVPTPNTHINNHFHDFKKDDYNRRDFFTPPSVTAHYLEKFGAERHKRPGVYQPPHQRPITPKSGSISNNFLIPTTATSATRGPRKNSFNSNSYSSSSGKYVPPNLRGTSPNIMKSPLHESVQIDDLDSDDDLFVLEEADASIESGAGLDGLGDSIATLSLDAYSSELSSAPSLIAPGSLLQETSKATSNTIHNRKPATGIVGATTVTSPSSHNKGKSGSLSNGSHSESNTKRVYVPPHHRENYNSHWNHNSQNRKPSFWNHHNNNNNNGGGHQARGRRMSAHKRHEISSSVPTKKTDWFPPSRVDFFEDDAGDDDDFENSEFYKNFASRVGEHSDPSLTAATRPRDSKGREIPGTIHEVNPLVIGE